MKPPIIVVSKGSRVVTGSRARFKARFKAGGSIDIGGTPYTIEEVGSDTWMRLVEPYAGDVDGELPCPI